MYQSMSDEEIKLMKEIGDKIIEMTNEFYRSKRSIESLQFPHNEIRELMNRYSSDYHMRATLYQYHKTILNSMELNANVSINK